MSEIVSTRFSLPSMDCPTEERLVRMALAPLQEVEDVAVDLDARTVSVTHRDAPRAVLEALEALGLGAKMLESVRGDQAPEAVRSVAHADEARVLKQLLVINAAMFVAELVVGWLAASTGLLADSLDMLADAFVYSLSLYAVGRSVSHQHLAARLSGITQLVLALGVLGEVGRRLVVGSEPKSLAMMAMAVVALVANSVCVWLLRRHRDGGVHMQASWIFSTNDALANLGVIVAGALVLVTGSPLPDLVIGALIALLVGRGAMRILALSKTRRAPTLQ